MEVIYYVAASADGFIATPAGGVQWLDAYQTEGDDYGYGDLIVSVDVVLMGRATYEAARELGGLDHYDHPTWVFTRRGLEAPDDRVETTGRSPEAVVEELSGTHGRAWLMGGGDLASYFQRAGLISEYRIFIVPELLGAGLQLFGEDGGIGSVRLSGVKSYESGIVELRYEP